MAEKFTILHNPRCRKSREALELLQHQCKDIHIVDYLKTPPTEADLKKILSLLGIKAEDLVRKGEEVYKEQYKGKALSEEEWIKAMVKHPILIERPIIIKDKDQRAVIGRPPENLLKLL